MFNRLIPWFSDYGDDVKAHRKVDAMITHISIGGLYEIANLLIRDSFYRVAILVALARLHLNNGNYTILLCNDVNLLVPQSPVALTYRVASSHEIRHRSILANLSKFIMVCHAYIYKGVVQPLFICRKTLLYVEEPRFSEGKLREKIAKIPFRRRKTIKSSTTFSEFVKK